MPSYLPGLDNFPSGIDEDRLAAGLLAVEQGRHSQQSVTEAVLVSGVDATLGEDIVCTLTADRVLGRPRNGVAGQRLQLVLTQGGAGNFALTAGTGVTFSNFALNATAGAVTTGSLVCLSPTSWVVASNPATGAYGTKTNAIVRPMGLNIATYAGYDGSGATFSDTALAAVIADLPSGGGRLYGPVGTPKFQTQLTIPVGMQLSLCGDGPLATKWLYQGVQQAWLIYPGQNQGSSFVDIAIGGFPADPLIQLLSNNGTGTNGYQSEITCERSVIGFLPVAPWNPPANTIAYRGIQVQNDVFRATNCEFGGRNIGIQPDFGCSDFWLTNCGTTVLPQAAEPIQAGIYCTPGGSPFGGSGHIINCLISGAGPNTTAAFLRSVIDVISTHCESSHLPFNLQTGKFTILGGTFNGDATCTTIFSANASSGRIAPANLSKTAALVNYVNIGNSTASWVLEMPDAAAVAGGLPATPIVCDWIGLGSKFPGYFFSPSGFSSYSAPAMLTAQGGAVGSIASIFTQNDGNKHFYRITMQVTITTHGTESINAQVTYTDSGAAARTLTIPLTNTAGTVNIAAAAADSFVGMATIACNPNTAITLKTAGTFTGSPVYNVAGQIDEIV